MEICLKSTSTAKPSEVASWAKIIIEKACRGSGYTSGDVTALLKSSDSVAAGGGGLSRHIHHARICEIVNPAVTTQHSVSASGSRHSVYLSSVDAWDATVQCYVYTLNEEGPSAESSAAQGGSEGGAGDGTAEVLTQYTQWNLPSADFEGVWEALLYDDDGDVELAGAHEAAAAEGADAAVHRTRAAVVGAGGGSGAMMVVDTPQAAGSSAEDGPGGTGTKRARTAAQDSTPVAPQPAGAGGGGGGGRKKAKGAASAADGSLTGSRLKPALLSYAQSAMLFSDCGVDASLIAWNHVVLLHGPPGTGKTSLCKALAHKLSIRLAGRFPTAQLIEINAHSLFSRWFSESGKLVHRLFGHIREMCEDEDGLVVLLIDEVESLTAARQAAVSGGEPSDAVRVVNAVLTAIDSFRTRKNVLLLTTSNVSEAIDLAFVDRADIKAYVGPPGTKARYDILASCVQELVRVGIVSLQVHGGLKGGRLATGHEYAAHVLAAASAASSLAAASPTATGSARTVPEGAAAEGGEGEGAPPPPPLVDMLTSAQVWRAAAAAEGFSGRTLRKLPLQAHAMHVHSSPGVPCPGPRFGQALLRAVQSERAARADLTD